MHVDGSLTARSLKAQGVSTAASSDVVQLTSNTTAVELTTKSGTITTFALVGLGATIVFTASGDVLDKNSVLIVSPQNDADAAAVITAHVESLVAGAANQRSISVTSTTAATDAPVVLNYRIL